MCAVSVAVRVAVCVWLSLQWATAWIPASAFSESDSRLETRIPLSGEDMSYELTTLDGVDLVRDI